MFWDMFLAYRVCWLMGRYGAGKTSLAVIMAAKLLAEKRVSKVISNIPLSFSTPIDTEIITPILAEKKVMIDTGILLDEAWIYLEDRQSVMEYAGFVRKFNHFLLLPSVFPIHPRLSFFYVQRIFNGYTLGLPFWVYKWSISNRGVKENGTFAIQYPTAVFGHYPSDFVPGDDGNISVAVKATAIASGFKGTRKNQGKKKEKELDEEYQNDDNSLSTDVAAMEDVAYQLEDAKDDIAKMVTAIKKARR